MKGVAIQYKQSSSQRQVPEVLLGLPICYNCYFLLLAPATSIIASIFL